MENSMEFIIIIFYVSGFSASFGVIIEKKLTSSILFNFTMALILSLGSWCALAMVVLEGRLLEIEGLLNDIKGRLK